MDITFVNHASVVIRHGDVVLLTDPWFTGPAFHKGWRLLVDTPEQDIETLLAEVTHIWVSHEHPDHFSVGFFKRWGDALRARGIQMLFQKIDDQRVADFLRGENLPLTEMTFGKSYPLSSDVNVTCLKDEFYDSALSIRAGDTHVLNLNDCAIGTTARAQEVRDAVGTCDILLTQFSYAAWKGGRANRDWRVAAAKQKIENINVQIDVLRPRMVIPFASFVAFAHARNDYLNDAANTPGVVVEAFADSDAAIQVMKPGDVTDGTADETASHAAVDWWQDIYKQPLSDLMTYDSVDTDRLRATFEEWRDRVHRANSRWAMRAAQRFSPIRILQPVVIYLDDTDQTWRIDPARGIFERTQDPADLTMHSESLWFLFSNSFGFDTLTVNGNFEESRLGGFSRAARSLAIENLNNLGVRFGPGLIFEPKIIGVFLERLRGVSARLRKSGDV